MAVLSELTEIFPMAKIMKIVAMPVCFLLKANMIIGCCPIMIFQEEQEPFYTVPYIEEYVQHFPHLCGMDQFVVNILICKIINCEYKPEDIDG